MLLTKPPSVDSPLKTYSPQRRLISFGLKRLLIMEEEGVGMFTGKRAGKFPAKLARPSFDAAVNKALLTTTTEVTPPPTC